MYYVYILQSLKDNKLYIGKTDDLKSRIKRHDMGLVLATKPRRPLMLIYYEAFQNKTDAGHEELFYKSGFGREALQSKLKYTLSQDGGVANRNRLYICRPFGLPRFES